MLRRAYFEILCALGVSAVRFCSEVKDAIALGEFGCPEAKNEKRMQGLPEKPTLMHSSPGSGAPLCGTRG